MEFRYLSESDATDIAAFVHGMWVDTYAPIVEGGRQRAESIFDDWVGPDRIRSDMAKGHFFAYCIADGKVIGMISAGKEDGGLEISKVYILPEERGKGYGKECLNFLLDRGRELGCRRAYLEVNHSNLAAIRFYENNGFRPAGRNNYDHSYTTVMAKELRSP